jgi:hypothetical protein
MPCFMSCFLSCLSSCLMYVSCLCPFYLPHVISLVLSLVFFPVVPCLVSCFLLVCLVSCFILYCHVLRSLRSPSPPGQPIDGLLKSAKRSPCFRNRWILFLSCLVLSCLVSCFIMRCLVLRSRRPPPHPRLLSYRALSCLLSLTSVSRLMFFSALFCLAFTPLAPLPRPYQLIKKRKAIAVFSQ